MRTTRSSRSRLHHALLASAAGFISLAACAADAPPTPTDGEESIAATSQALIIAPPPEYMVVEDDCPEDTSYDFTYGSAKLLLCSHKDPFAVDEQVKRAIVLVRGSNWQDGGYDYYYENTLQEAYAAGIDLDEIDIIAPRLLRDAVCKDPDPEDTDPTKECVVGGGSYGGPCYDDDDCRPEGYYRWNSRYIGGSMDQTGFGVSAFQALDALLIQIASRRPNLEIIVVAGQSQGAQFVSRYAASSVLNATPNIELRYWAANAGGLPWLDGSPPNPVAGAQCASGISNWPWGPDNLYQYHATYGLDANDLIDNLLERDIFWTVGEKDTDPSASTDYCSRSQGEHRNERWENYRAHLYQLCLDRQLPHCASLRDEQFLEIPGAKHGMKDSWKTAIGHKILFDTVHGNCSEEAVDFEVFDGLGADMVGCAGTVSFANRNSLCAPGYQACSAYQWATFRDDEPSYNYWTNDALKYGGSGDGSCWADETIGYACPSQSPMHVCTKNTSGTDALGNTCNWDHCGYDGSTDNAFFGGCVGNTTAGTLCCPVPQ